MPNLHLVVLTAGSAEEAMEIARNGQWDWSAHLCTTAACLDQTGRVFSGQLSRFTPVDPEDLSLEMLNARLLAQIKADGQEDDRVRGLMNTYLDGGHLDQEAWKEIGDHALRRAKAAPFSGYPSFSCWEDEYNSELYHQLGVTNLTGDYSNPADLTDNEKYLVLLHIRS